MSYVLGVDLSSLSNVYIDPVALQAAANQLIAQGSEADALSVATDINSEVDEMVTRLIATGGQDALVASGTNIENRAYDVVANYDPNVGDPSIPGKVAAINSSMNDWQTKAWGVFRSAPAAAGTTAGAPIISSIVDSMTGTPAGSPGDTVSFTGTNFTGTTAVDFNGVPAQFQVVSATQLTATVPQGATSGALHVTNSSGVGVSAFTITAATTYTDPGSYGGSSGGSSGGGGLDEGGDSGDPGNIDWGDGEQPADRGGGGDPMAADSSVDQGIDWGDSGDQRSQSTESDPFSNFLPTDDGAVDQSVETEDTVVGQYLDGVDIVVGGSSVVGDEAHPPFDNRHIYHPGEIVTYWGQYWQSTRDVLPPMFPLFMTGEVPGSNDAWKSLTADDVVNHILGVNTIPTAGANYTDKKTVGAVQFALNNKGFGPLKLDGLMGPKTTAAIRAMQLTAGIPPTGNIDEGVISALKVTPGVLPPGVTLQQKTDVEVQAALDAATAVEHSITPADLQAAAQKVVDAAPAQPPELKQAAVEAHTAVLTSQTPAQFAIAKQQVQAVAQQITTAVQPGWWANPLWDGAPVNRLQGIAGTVGVVALVVGIVAAVRR